LRELLYSKKYAQTEDLINVLDVYELKACGNKSQLIETLLYESNQPVDDILGTVEKDTQVACHPDDINTCPCHRTYNGNLIARVNSKDGKRRIIRQQHCAKEFVFPMSFQTGDEINQDQRRPCFNIFID
jgi:hypothetical protein